MKTEKPPVIFETGEFLCCQTCKKKGRERFKFKVRVCSPQQKTVELICSVCGHRLVIGESNVN